MKSLTRGRVAGGKALIHFSYLQSHSLESSYKLRNPTQLMCPNDPEYITRAHKQASWQVAVMENGVIFID